ncbi:D-alanyl-D-alanine carboxypeptidase (penicillin-binding protein 5/6) [Streptomyces sp. Ncost-T6T-1]|uniref:D-alanyl-D-alanine carboxypeptidase family protein n=1 Tax=Streptomyces sp. Ncost-T6T-1 TaxID=1100828 RepID=UPI000805E454|nr:D-alanyl-D-alanine carboxypeptidase [Streptomyces sp. Ncost-T6T-1]SBV02288.1 D-alanyl-D-alanine carboxypeptidase (penicillin-binding protein 5/6) [Streptomyces sp. Ncost-T6T-1]
MPVLKKIALTVTSAALLSGFVLTPAVAADKDKSDDKQPKPPGVMSSLGGERLSMSGSQVNLGPGVPVLPKGLTGRSWIVADAENGDVLAAHNSHWRLPPASTLKMLFADTVLPALQPTQTHKVTESELAGVGEGSSLVGIKEDHTYTVHDLWLGVFLRSGNDAVHVLSEMYGGIPQTVAAMQKHAEELQALDTVVVSPDGYDAPRQVSSAYDLTLIARSGMQKKDFREYAATASADFPGEKKKGKKRDSFEIQNTNRLITGDIGVDPYKGIAGVKNGYTTHAGNTFTGVAERNGKVLLVTVMNPSAEESHAVYKEAAKLLDWGFAASGKVTPVGELVPPKSVDTGTGTSTGGKGAAPAAGADQGTGGQAEAAHASAASKGSSGVGVALAIIGGLLVVVAAAVFLVNRRWPLAGLGGRGAPETKDTGEAADPKETAEPAASVGESSGKPADKA